MQNFIDNNIAYFFNQYVHRSQVIDALIYQISENHLFKGGVVLSLVCFAWFKSNIADVSERKRNFLTLFIVAVIAMTIARAIAIFAPFRYRPVYDPILGLNMPYSVNGWILNGWSSFPSDHASLFFALSLSLWYLHKRTGYIAMAYTVVMIALPRLLLGFHFLTDELVGALIGGVAAWYGYAYLIHTRFVTQLIAFSEQKPEYFYSVLLLFVVQLFEMFESARNFFPTLKWCIKELLLKLR